MLGKIETTELPNGCRVVTSAMPGVDSVSLCFDAGSGGRFERPAEGGFSHFLEHMLFKGSAKRPTTRALSRPLERVGGQFNAYTSAEHTCFHATVPAAINGPLYVRFRSLGINGSGAVQTGKGWSDIKFIDISFQ